MSPRNISIVLVALVIIAGVGYVGAKAIRKTMRATTTPNQTETITTPTDTASTATQSANLVTINTSGFSPNTITIKVGETVRWVNSNSVTENVSSDPHPTHTLYTPLNLGNIEAGSQISLTFDKAGTYTYHNHLRPSLKGTVVVE
jgi:plastocyanin